MSLVALALGVIACSSATVCLADGDAADSHTAPGWRMVDRFAGFRFEVVAPTGSGFSASHFMDAAVEQADEVAGFGWVQHVEARGGRSGEVVVAGEFRGNKHTARMFKDWLASDAVGGGVASIRDYEDTKIRFHFSHFRILPPGRDTCFEEPPHACADMEGSAGGKADRPGGVDHGAEL